MASLTIVKLGGAQLDTPHLRAWLQALEEAVTPIVVVPGGGPFADAVRDTSSRLALSESAAHRMALLAMNQVGEALCDLSPRLRLATSGTTAAAALDGRLVPVFAPYPALLGAAGLAETWAFTSDSIALWLARRWDAPSVLLIKALDTEGDVELETLSRRGVVDRAFPSQAELYGGDIRFVGPASHEATAADWRAGRPGGLLVRPSLAPSR